MKYEIRNISSFRVGNTVFAVYGVISLISIAMAYVAFYVDAEGVSGGVHLIFGNKTYDSASDLWAPAVLHTVLGWLGGFVAAVVYNISVDIVGGIRVELDPLNNPDKTDS